MSKTSMKRYLMLLGAIGLVAFASGGAGTFASFNAEVTNTGNYFASGTLILNDNGGINTCTSAGDSTNLNNLSTNGCDTLFQVNQLGTPTAKLSTALVSGTPAAVLDFTGGSNPLINGAIDAGDSLTVTSGIHTHSFTATQSAPIGSTSVTVSSDDPLFSYPIGSKITDSSTTQYAKLTLTNAGTLDAGAIKATMPSCTSTAAEGTALLTGGPLAGSVGTINFSAGVTGAFRVGDPIVVTSGIHTQTFISTQNVANGGTSVTVNADNANFAYPDGSTVSGPSFTPAGDLCSALKMSIVETDASFDVGSPAAEGCAFGVVDPTYNVGCTLNSGTDLASFAGSAHTLTLASGILGNTGTNLSASQSRYFLIGVKLPSPGFADNTFQNLKAAFDLKWHIDQA